MKVEPCATDCHQWGGESLTLDGRRIVQSMDGIWRCNGKRRRCRLCGLEQDASDQPLPAGKTTGIVEYEEWQDTTYSPKILKAPAYDPRVPTQKERLIEQMGYPAELAHVLARES